MNSKALRLTLLALLSLTALLRTAADQPDRVTFVFAPPVNKVMDEKARMTITSSMKEMSMSYGIDGTSATRISKLENGGYLFDTKIDLLDITNNGPEQMDMVGQILGSSLMSAVKTFYSDDGKVERIEGLDEMRRSLASHLPPEMAGLADMKVDNDLLLKQKRLEFQNRLGRFVGKTVGIGDLWLDSTTVPFPGAMGGTPFPIYRATRIIGWEKMDGCDVLLITIINHANPEGLAKVINRTVKEVKAAGPAKPAALPKGMTLYTVINLAVDPLTMRVFSERIDTRISFAGTTPSGEKMTAYAHITEDHKFTYRQ
ncbi:MAG: hypothetical protein ACYC6A_08395 [Armatimonadota bacterium]